MAMRMKTASTRIPPARPRPNSLMTRSPPRMNDPNTRIMIRAAAVIVLPVAASPLRTASRVVPGLQPLLVDAGDEEDLVVHRQPEEDGEQHHREERLDRTGSVDPEHAAQPAPLEDGHQDAEGRADRQQVHDRRGQRDDEAAEDDGQQQERQQDDQSDEQRQLGRQHVGEVGEQMAVVPPT